MHIYVLMHKLYFFAVTRIILAVLQTSAVRHSSTDILSIGVTKAKNLISGKVYEDKNGIKVKVAPVISLKLDGICIKSDVSSYIENNRTMVPIRVISESLGVNVETVCLTQVIT